MALIVTFLGKGGTGRTTTAIAIAKKLAILGSRVLLAGQDPTLGWLWSVPLTPSVTFIEPNLSGVHLCSTVLLEQGWEQIKELESQYLRSPTLKKQTPHIFWFRLKPRKQSSQNIDSPLTFFVTTNGCTAHLITAHSPPSSSLITQSFHK